MADDAPGGTQQLEDVEAQPASPPSPAPPAAIPPEVPADKPAEVDSVEVGGEKYVPVSALQAERQRRQELSQKASRVDELEAFVREAQPYVNFLKANPQVMQPRQEQPVKPAESVEDPDALEAAKLMDFYRADGQPDTARGAQWLKLQDRRAQRVAQTTIQPMREQSAQERSTQNFALALQMQDADGRKPSPEALRTVWQAMPAEYTADPQVASLLAVTALGLDQVQRKSPPKAPDRDPVITESSGGGPRNQASMTELETRVAQQKGVTATRWQEATKGFQKNRPSPLED